MGSTSCCGQKQYSHADSVMAFRTNKQKAVLLAYGMLEQILVSGALFGWVALVFVLKEDGYFSSLCDVENSANKTTQDSLPYCAAQSERLNLAYTVAVVVSGVVIVVVGVLIDKHGPRAARHIGSLFLAGSGIFWFFASTEMPNLIFPAVTLFALAGVFWTATWMQVGALVYNSHQSTVICLLSAAFDASAVMLLIIKITHSAQKTLKINQLMSAYCGLCTVTSIIATLTIIPTRKSVQEDLDDKILQDGIERVRQMSIRSYGGTFDDVLSSTGMAPIPEQVEQMDEANSQLMLQKESKKTTMLHPDSAALNGPKEGQNVAVIGLQCSELEYLESAMRNRHKSEFLRLARSSVYLWHVAFSSLVILRINFYVSSFDSSISWLSKGSETIVDQYINAFGIFQFFGALFAPIMGPYLDGRLCMKGKQSSDQKSKLRRCALALAITNTVALLLAAMVVTPILEAQYIAMLSQVVLRGFFFAVHFSFVAEAFPGKHYGKLSCLALLIAVIIASLQYPLYIAVERLFSGNPFWVNIGLLVLTLVLYGQPIHLKQSLKKKRKTVNLK